MTSAIVGDAKKPNAAWPVLKAKAAETRHLIPVLLQTAQDLNDGSSHAKHRQAALNCAVVMQKTLEQQGMFMSNAAHDCLLGYSKSFLAHYTALRTWAKQTDFWGYHCVPKFHMGGVHIPLQAKFINPRFVWTYKAEDWVGRLAKIAHSACFGTSSHMLSHKLVEKYMYLLHLYYTRGIVED